MASTTTSSSKRKHSEAELEEELRECARDGYLAPMRELVDIQRVNVNCADKHGDTPLILAARNGRLRIVQLLLEKGADLNIVDADGDPAVSNAVYKGHVATTQLLLERDASVDSQIHVETIHLDTRGASSLLGWAIYDENVDTAEVASLRYKCEQHEKRSSNLLAENQRLKMQLSSAGGSDNLADGTPAACHVDESPSTPT